MPRSICLAAMIVLAPCAALAADPSENSQHSGKPVDGKTNGKTNGMTDTSAEKIGQQQKTPPKTGAGDAQPAKAGTADANGVKSP